MKEEIHFEIMTDVDMEKAKSLWEQFSYKVTLFDLWDFRYCFYKYDNFPVRFIIGSVKGEPIGLLALQENTEDKCWEFFGGSWMERNNVYVKPGFEMYIEDFYMQVPAPALLGSIYQTDQYSVNLPLDDYNYRLDISYYQNFWDYISDKYSKKGQQTYKRKIRIIEEQKVEFLMNNFEDIDLLIALNLKNFGEESSFNDVKRQQVYKDFLKLDLPIFLQTILIDGKKEAVSLCIKYNETMYYLNAGSNYEAVPNLGNYKILQDIDTAIREKCKMFDALMIAYNWKERWHFDKVPYTKFEKA